MSWTDIATTAALPTLRRLALPCAVALAVCGPAAHAQAFKCTDAQGRISYQQTPCPHVATGDAFVDPLTRQRQEGQAARRAAIAQQRAQYRQQQLQEIERLRQAVLQHAHPLPRQDDAAALLGLSDNESIVPVDATSTTRAR